MILQVKKLMNKLFTQVAIAAVLILSTVPIAGAQDEVTGGATKNGGWSTVSYGAVPIEITIQSGTESILTFPWRVHLGSSNDILSMVRNLPIGDSIYLTPLMEFDSKRFVAEDPATGSTMLLDITATKEAPPRMLRFVDNRPNMAKALAPLQPAASSEKNQEAPIESGGEYSYALLTRMALQFIYSPKSVITTLDGVSRSPIGQARSINDLIIGENVIASPSHVWRTKTGLYVIAVRVLNLGNQAVDLDQRRMRHTTTWISSAFWSTRLEGAGDETTLVVVSSTSWNKGIAQRGNLLTSNTK